MYFRADEIPTDLLEYFEAVPTGVAPNVWTLGPEPTAEAHFATFVSEIPRRAILAGTSERGCCPACGAPWTRVTEREGLTARDKANAVGWSPKANGKGLPAQGLDYAGRHGDNVRDAVTLGWQPSCACPPADAVPCVVMDPFAGSCTSNAVAKSLGRKSIGIDLNAKYLDIGIRRVEAVTLPMAIASDLPEVAIAEGEQGVLL